jgi:hypothetical protein
LKTKTINDIQSKNALQRMSKTNMKNDFSRQTIESSPQVNATYQRNTGFESKLTITPINEEDHNMSAIESVEYDEEKEKDKINIL